MATKKDAETTAENAVKPKNKQVFQKSRKRTSLDEFAITHNLRSEVKAGFKAWLHGELFHFDAEWESLFDKYNNRTLG